MNFNQTIADHFNAYEVLLKASKKVWASPIVISGIKRNQINFKRGDITVYSTSTRLDFKLEAEVKISDHRVFHFKLNCTGFCKCPLTRYDSSGSAHRNRNLPLNEQQIDVPHFHKFGKDGYEFAYQTEQMKTGKFLDELAIIDNALKHYCEENQVRYNEEQFPTIDIFGDELPINVENADPLYGIKF